MTTFDGRDKTLSDQCLTRTSNDNSIA